VGREQEVKELRAQLQGADVRLVTLIGQPGVGKTRLSLEIAADLAPAFSDGVYFVPLAAITDSELVGQAIAGILGVKEAPGEMIQQSLVAFLRNRRLLLVLDNFEQVVLAAPLVAELLSASPGLKILVTSREPLGLWSEWLFDVDGLPYPPDDNAMDLEAYSAVRLFTQRARQIQRRWVPAGSEAQAVARICRLVEGLPLAIELAASAVRERSCVEIANEIERGVHALARAAYDLPERHQSMRAALEHSWQLLCVEERCMFPRLAVFRGGFVAAAALDVAGTQPALLSRFVHRSLLRHSVQADGTSRYYLHELVRHYGGEKLREAGETVATRDRHLSFFLHLAEASEPLLTGPQKAEWLTRLEREHDNLRAALAWALESHQVESALRLGAALGQFWCLHGHWSEGRSWLARALAKSDPSSCSVGRGTALLAAGRLADYQSDYAAAISLLEESESVFRDLGDDLRVALAWQALAHIAHNRREFQRARTLWDQVLPVFRASGDPLRIGQALHGLGYVLLNQGDYERAAQLFDEGLLHYRAVGDRGQIGSSLTFAGYLAWLRGDFVRARALCEEATLLTREVGDKQGLAWALRQLGDVAYSEGDYDGATTYISESLKLRWELRDPHGSAWSLEGLADIARLRGQVERAVRLWGQAEALREHVGVPLARHERELRDGHVASARTYLGAERFEQAWGEGVRMSLEEVVEYALEADNQ
jgi:predicted ATPase/Tfp pilus assembly protein PilF